MRVTEITLNVRFMGQIPPNIMGYIGKGKGKGKIVPVLN
jgi:hypothetical protein